LIFDLHSHSNLSDGELHPVELVKRAVAQNVDVLAITDHDTIDACHMDTASGEKITLVSGIELSTQWENTGIHVLGLNFDIHDSAIQEAASVQTGARQERAVQIAHNLAKQGISDALEGAIRHAPGNYLGRPHFAQHIVETGQAKSMQAAFKKYLGAGKAGDVKKTWADLPQIIRWIRESGGIAVLAHPLKYKLTGSKLKRLLQAFREQGGQGIEVISGRQTPEEIKRMTSLCSDMGMLASCGSDFHRPDSPWAELGQFAPLPQGLKPVWDAF
jgi:predicted metal-dependent phosphoesterase TrpH